MSECRKSKPSGKNVVVKNKTRKMDSNDDDLKDVRDKFDSAIQQGRLKPPNVGLYDSQINDLLNSFECEYVGSVQPLSDRIDSCYKEFLNPKAKGTVYDSPDFAILQSSGTGKSRSVAELAKSRFVIYICFRRNGSSGYPVGSPPLLTKEMLLLGDNDAEWRSFFGATVAALHSLLLLSPADPKPDEYKELFVKVTSHAKQSITENKVDLPSILTKAKLNSSTFFRKLALERGNEDEPYFASLFWYSVRSCLNAVRKLPEDKTKNWTFYGHHILTPYCHWLGGDAEIPLVFAFDEATEMIYSKVAEKPPFYGLRLGLNDPSLGIFALFLDTDARVVDFRPSDGKCTWADFKKENLFDPWVHPLPMDRCATKAPSTLKEACKAEYLMVLGRPLWARNWYPNLKDYQDDAVALASCKLGGFVCKAEEITNELAVRMIAPRVQFISKPSSVLSSVLVDSLALLHVINEDRTKLWCYYVSEPVVVTACTMKWMVDKNILSTAIDTVVAMILDGSCDGGRMGEFVARLLLVLAWDETNNPSLSRRHLEAAFQPKPIGHFLETLIGKPKFGELLEMANRKPWISQLFDGQLLFTHFARLHQRLNKDPLVLLDLIRRGAGGYFAICSKQTVDLAIPFVVDTNGPLNPKNLSAIFIQVKNWNDPDFSSADQKEDIWLDFCSEDAVNVCKINNRPFISLVFVACHTKPSIRFYFNPDFPLGLGIVIRDADSFAFLGRKEFKGIRSSVKLCTEFIKAGVEGVSPYVGERVPATDPRYVGIDVSRQLREAAKN